MMNRKQIKVVGGEVEGGGNCQKCIMGSNSCGVAPSGRSQCSALMFHLTGYDCRVDNVHFEFKEFWEKCTRDNILAGDTVRGLPGNGHGGPTRGIVQYVLQKRTGIERFIVSFGGDGDGEDNIRELYKYERLVTYKDEVVGS